MPARGKEGVAQGVRERPIWIGDREREAAGGRKGGEVRERYGLVWWVFSFVCMDGWMDVGLLAMDGRMSAISSIRATNGSTNHNVVRTLMIL